jgi:hypothetical protein
MTFDLSLLLFNNDINTVNSNKDHQIKQLSRVTAKFFLKHLIKLT